MFDGFSESLKKGVLEIYATTASNVNLLEAIARILRAEGETDEQILAFVDKFARVNNVLGL